ncbi:glycosyltransferase family 4 protein [bacterium]|nr:glycosyltransferase family 4 protein [bacterium]
MRIAQISPIVERVPPKKYGGTERMVHALTEELVKRGHEVTLFASGDSLTSAKLESVYPRGIREAKMKDIYGLNPWTLLNLGLAYELQDEFDIIHDHLAPVSLPIANLATTPVVMTMHGAFNAETKKLFQTLHGPHIVTISEAQMYSLPSLNHAGTVYNGLPMDDYPFGEEMGEYLLYVGRISQEKGVHFAIEVAQQLDLPLIIAAKVDPQDQLYFKEYIEPRLSDRIQWIGEVNEEERNKLMMNARCFLHPVTWREPFGLTLIEAMATGCPVVAFDKGSIPEIIDTGVTGFVVQDLDTMIEAVENIGNIDRAVCRERALTNFSATKMADGYEAVYMKVLEEHA